VWGQGKWLRPQESERKLHLTFRGTPGSLEDGFLRHATEEIKQNAGVEMNSK
jgi:hypothetical protein